LCEEKTMNDQDKSAHILAVDDTPENLDVLTGLLQPQYRVRAAVNGERALRIAAADPAPDLILLDVMMPGMDGFEVCRRLKADPRTRDIPVIFLTAVTEKESTVKGFELGAVDYVTKPFTPAELLARVDAHLSLYTLRRRLEQLVEERTAQLRHRVRELDGRDRLNHLQMTGAPLPEAYEAILKVAEDVLKAEKVVLYLPEAGRLTPKAALGLSGPGILEDEARLGDEGAVLLTDRDSPVAQTFLDHRPRSGGGREAMVPILYNEKALGVLWADIPEEDGLDRQTVLESLWRLGQEAALTLCAAQVRSDLETGDIDVAGLLKLGADRR
jgi:CheY-like chemotaxis protein